jgi:hypothetical protein
MTAARWPEVERLYHEALTGPVDMRAAFLADACAGNEGLRLEVEYWPTRRTLRCS